MRISNQVMIACSCSLLLAVGCADNQRHARYAEYPPAGYPPAAVSSSAASADGSGKSR